MAPCVRAGSLQASLDLPFYQPVSTTNASMSHVFRMIKPKTSISEGCPLARETLQHLARWAFASDHGVQGVLERTAMAPSADIQILIEAARGAGFCLLDDFSRLEHVGVREKNPSDFVSSADLRSQDLLQARLSAAYPDYELVLEEGGPRGHPSEKSQIFVDPLDGTTNFLHGIPHFAVSIGLAREGTLIAGVVFDPTKGELFWAERGRGAWLGERRLSVSRERALSLSVVGTGIPHHGARRHSEYLEALGRITPKVAGVRRMGCASLDLAYVAAARFEAFFEMSLAPWDIAAGVLLVLESGGQVTREDGSALTMDAGGVLASNGEPMHDVVLDLISPIVKIR
jgi:myo-inositol-1(or 4)-monophosphatase